MLKKLEKNKEISQDDEKRGHDEMQKLRGMAARGIEISAQDVPTARAIPLEELG